MTPETVIFLALVAASPLMPWMNADGHAHQDRSLGQIPLERPKSSATRTIGEANDSISDRNMNEVVLASVLGFLLGRLQSELKVLTAVAIVLMASAATIERNLVAKTSFVSFASPCSVFLTCPRGRKQCLQPWRTAPIRCTYPNQVVPGSGIMHRKSQPRDKSA